MARGKAWRRYKNYTKARRKRKIDAAIYSGSNWWYPWYNNLHQYSKNKIHCSCPMCRSKSRNRRAAARFHGSWNPTMMDLRKKMSMDDDYGEYLEDS